jgi:hypothetical protein
MRAIIAQCRRMRSPAEDAMIALHPVLLTKCAQQHHHHEDCMQLVYQCHYDSGLQPAAKQPVVV